MEKAIFVIGGALKKEKGKWRTTNFQEEDNFGISGDRLRIIATSYLFKEDPNTIVIASGGKGQHKDIISAPSVSNVIKKELVELGLPTEKIIEESKSNNTFQQLQQLKKIMKQYNFDKIAVVSNKYHLPRIKAIIQIDKELKKMLNNSKIKLVSAERVALKHQPEIWQSEIEEAYKSKSMKQRIVLEKNGIQDIKQGVYKFK